MPLLWLYGEPLYRQVDISQTCKTTNKLQSLRSTETDTDTTWHEHGNTPILKKIGQKLGHGHDKDVYFIEYRRDSDDNWYMFPHDNL